MQVGFREPLNYAFVAKNQAAQNQLVEYIPPGLSYVTVVQGEEVTMHSLRADNNVTVFPSYITTLAFVYMPTRSIDILKSTIQAPDSPLYNNPDDSTRKLMSYIDPAIPINTGPSPNPNVTTAGSSPTPELSPSGLSPGARIGIGIGISILLLAVLVAGFLFWQRRREALHSQAAAPVENENENRTEMPADDEKAGELYVEHGHELSAEERQEVSADSWRRELHGPEFVQELEARENTDR